MHGLEGLFLHLDVISSEIVSGRRIDGGSSIHRPARAGYGPSRRLPIAPPGHHRQPLPSRSSAFAKCASASNGAAGYTDDGSQDESAQEMREATVKAIGDGKGAEVRPVAAE